MRDIITRVLEAINQRRVGLVSPSVQKWLLMVAAAVFAGGAWFAANRMGLDADRIEPWPLLGAAFIGVPLTIATNVMEYQFSALVLGHRIPLWPAARLSVLATAANALPLPGGVAVRLRALHEEGSDYGSAFISTALVGLMWLGVSLTLAGISLFLAYRSPYRPSPFVLVGLVLMLSAWFLLRSRRLKVSSQIKLYLFGTLIEVLSVVATALRVFFVLTALGEGPSLARTLVLSSAYVISAAIGVVPGGLGLREGLAAAVAPVVDLSASVGFAVVGLDRIVAAVVLSPVALAFGVKTVLSKDAAVDREALPDSDDD